ncbi:methyl-accepting chemotaxis protein [Sphingomonas sp. RIT328]|uniref:methyl-accepting chemotaxis protein n=1 Tax=Sphingomonas sp. RIT328 TaxID=1470591 RepID=UPI000449567D|nr:methyl-accepting chemotaxis protein [Sphingomonas sp. RIT328]EZP48644.1 Methyl-accepting chemotaxis (MCP) signaling domain protein [Sphingomonas sp. RIT328]
MLTWFANHAPIRSKFRVLLGVHGAVAATGVLTTYLAAEATPAEATVYVGIAATLFLVTIAVVLFSGKVISDPYVGSVTRMEGLAAGDLASPIPFGDHRDCIGRMARAVTVFKQNAEAVQAAAAAQQIVVGALGEGLTRLASSDLAYRIDQKFPPDYERLRTDYNRALDAVAETIRAVTDATNGINSGAIDIRQASDDLSQRTEQQAASLEETAAAMDEITATVRQTAAGAVRASGVVEEARVEAEQSGAVVRRAVDAMSGIERASNEISDIISVIDGIAFQTNLLALNAGVEAARAGDAGRGFAVVASEVRALAQRSAEAAKDVKTRITASSEQVESGVELVSETGKALDRIIVRIAEINALVAEIASAAEQQATGLQQVNTAVSEMDGVTQQNAAMVEQATAAARSLSAEADELARQVARFKLAGVGHSGGEAVLRAVPVVHQLQDRAADAGRRIARAARRTAPMSSSGGTALAVSPEDWSEF